MLTPDELYYHNQSERLQELEARNQELEDEIAESEKQREIKQDLVNEYI